MKINIAIIFMYFVLASVQSNKAPPYDSSSTPSYTCNEYLTNARYGVTYPNWGLHLHLDFIRGCNYVGFDPNNPRDFKQLDAIKGLFSATMLDGGNIVCSKIFSSNCYNIPLKIKVYLYNCLANVGTMDIYGYSTKNEWDRIPPNDIALELLHNPTRGAHKALGYCPPNDGGVRSGKCKNTAFLFQSWPYIPPFIPNVSPVDEFYDPNNAAMFSYSSTVVLFITDCRFSYHEFSLSSPENKILTKSGCVCGFAYYCLDTDLPETNEDKEKWNLWTNNGYVKMFTTANSTKDIITWIKSTRSERNISYSCYAKPYEPTLLPKTTIVHDWEKPSKWTKGKKTTKRTVPTGQTAPPTLPPTLPSTGPSPPPPPSTPSPKSDATNYEYETFLISDTTNPTGFVTRVVTVPGPIDANDAQGVEDPGSILVTVLAVTFVALLLFVFVAVTLMLLQKRRKKKAIVIVQKHRRHKKRGNSRSHSCSPSPIVPKPSINAGGNRAVEVKHKDHARGIAADITDHKAGVKGQSRQPLKSPSRNLAGGSRDQSKLPINRDRKDSKDRQRRGTEP